MKVDVLVAEIGSTTTVVNAFHGLDGGRAPASGIEPIKGQSAADLLKKLEGYKDGSFGAQRKLVMENVVKQLSDEQLKSLADYASTL